MHVLVVDTGHANLRSVEKALELAGREITASVRVERSSDPERLRRADKLVVPGQGGFGRCMQALSGGVGEALRERVSQGAAYLGICLGLQALFEASEEAPDVPGLGLLPGHVQKLQAAPGIKIPHMGWNQVHLTSSGHPVLAAAGGEGSWFYFVHSFHAVPGQRDLVKAVASHGPHQVTAAVARDNLIATQFHPEKSQKVGHRLLTAFLRW